ncbi:regulator of microtubule dynamics protein 3-like [Salarias fasciatus]|uniref:Regulator of microtubule dynamics protein 3 n=1 Tax=Salarias fasciatus TaxID=181472 RepID=A0A672G9U5_SALFA|nr:regulator of microtubule dynamics protein 3-like [Salarias fasciatus]
MNAPLGRRGLVGLAVGLGAAAGLSFITFIIYRAVSRRRRLRLAGTEAARPAGEGTPRPAALRRLEAADGAALLRDVLDAQEGEAQAQALAAVEAAVQGLSPEHQLELRNQLDQVLSCVSSLRSEVAELRGGLQDIALQIIQDVKKGVEDSQRLRRRRHVLHRERTDSTSSSSIYFTASQGAASAYEETSEGGYSTAYAESDYTDRETDREEGEQENEQDSDEEEDQSCATVVTLRLGEEEEEEEEERGLEDQEEEQGYEEAKPPRSPGPSGELALLLAQSDVLHTGDASLKAEGYRLLLENREEYGESREFLWRLARAYRDMYECAEGPQDKVMYGQLGREEAEKALQKNGLTAECHKWFALATGLTTQHESLHGKMKSTKILKEHLDRALALRDDDPVVFYLLGRWCYVVATMDWLERMGASTVYQSPPSATLHDALRNFHKAEELSPGFCRKLRLYIAKCYKELDDQYESSRWTELALRTSSSTEDDEETLELLTQLRPSEKKP